MHVGDIRAELLCEFWGGKTINWSIGFLPASACRSAIAVLYISLYGDDSKNMHWGKTLYQKKHACSAFEHHAPLEHTQYSSCWRYRHLITFLSLICAFPLVCFRSLTTFQILVFVCSVRNKDDRLKREERLEELEHILKNTFCKLVHPFLESCQAIPGHALRFTYNSTNKYS